MPNADSADYTPAIITASVSFLLTVGGWLFNEWRKRTDRQLDLKTEAYLAAVVEWNQKVKLIRRLGKDFRMLRRKDHNYGYEDLAYPKIINELSKPIREQTEATERAKFLADPDMLIDLIKVDNAFSEALMAATEVLWKLYVPGPEDYDGEPPDPDEPPPLEPSEAEIEYHEDFGPTSLSCEYLLEASVIILMAQLKPVKIKVRQFTMETPKKRFKRKGALDKYDYSLTRELNELWRENNLWFGRYENMQARRRRETWEAELKDPLPLFAEPS